MDTRVPRLLIFSLTAVAVAVSQPAMRQRSPVVNSASFRTPGLPGSGIARGSIFTIFGSGLGPASYVQAQTFPLPTKLAEVSVSVTVGNTTTPAIVLLASANQINALLPSSTPAGSGVVQVTYNGRTSGTAPIQVVDSAFGIYTFYSQGGQAIATDPGYQINSIIRTFHPGDYAILWGTGLGPIDGNDADTPPVGNLPGTIKVYVGNTAANVSYQGRSGCCSGLDQIVIQIPAAVQGCHVPVAVQTSGGVSNIATIAVSGSGQTCTDSIMGQDLVDKLAAGGKVGFGYVRLESLIAPFLAGSSAMASMDLASATFSEFTPQTAALAEYGVSTGYCVVADCSYGCGVKGYDGSMADSSIAQLDAGRSLAVQGQGTGNMPGYQGFYGNLLNNPGSGSRFLWSDLAYTVSGTGGTNVGPFSVTERTGIAGVQFSNIRSGQKIPLANDLTLEWTGGDAKLQNGQVTIGAYSGNSDLTQWVWLQCVAPAAAKKFTIPSWVLSTLPPAGSGVNGTTIYPQGWIWIGQYNTPVPFTATGLDRGILTDAFFNGFGVYFQ